MATPVRSKKIELTRAETEKFISYYQSHDCLWHVSSQFYSRREHRQAAYTSIAQLMGDCMTADQVPLKISALRTYYSKELRKEVQSRKSGAGRDDLYKSSWEWFSMLDPFLRSQVTPKPSISNMEAELTSEEAAAPTTTVAATEAVPTEHVQWASPPISPTLAPKRKKNVSSSLQEKLLNTIKSIEQRREQRESCNELLFGKYIASEVSNISDVRKRRELKFKIQQLIFEYQNEE